MAPNRAGLGPVLVPFQRKYLPKVRSWFDDPEAQRWLGGPDWPEMVLRLTSAFAPGQEFRGRIVLSRHSMALLDGMGKPVALIDGELYDRETRFAGEGPDGPEFVDAPGPHRSEAGLSVIVDPRRRRQGWGRLALCWFMEHPDLAAADAFVAGIEPENIASRRLFERLGFTLESTMPDWEDMLNYRKIVTHTD